MIFENQNDTLKFKYFMKTVNLKNFNLKSIRDFELNPTKMSSLLFILLAKQYSLILELDMITFELMKEGERNRVLEHHKHGTSCQPHINQDSEAHRPAKFGCRGSPCYSTSNRIAMVMASLLVASFLER